MCRPANCPPRRIRRKFDRRRNKAVPNGAIKSRVGKAQALDQLWPANDLKHPDSSTWLLAAKYRSWRHCTRTSLIGIDAIHRAGSYKRARLTRTTCTAMRLLRARTIFQRGPVRKPFTRRICAMTSETRFDTPWLISHSATVSLVSAVVGSEGSYLVQ